MIRPLDAPLGVGSAAGIERSVHGIRDLVRESLFGLAMRKKGLTEKHYLSPLTVDDGRK